MELYDTFATPFLEIEELLVPKPEVAIEELEVEDLVTMHAKLLYELQFLPRGTLAVRRRGQRVYYSLQSTIHHSRRDRYLSLRRDADLIEVLKKKKLIRSALTRIRKASRDLPGYRRRLAAKQAIIDRRHADNYIYYTNKTYVCSTAEAAIVEMLHKHHVRFEYAPRTYIGGWYIHPDFKYMVDGQPVYHEHLGLLDDAGYQEDWHRKHARYRYENLVDGVDLLISTAHGKRIDLVEIEQMLHARGVF
jgi:hypothetical protein